jgi:hypothetical protein
MNLSITEAQREWILAWVIERLNLLKSLNNPNMPGLLNVSKIFERNWKNYARKRTSQQSL